MAITLETIVKLPTSRKILILAGLVAVIVGLYLYLIYWPNLDLLKKKKAEMGTLETQVRELRIVAANMKRFQAEAAKLREELQLAITQLPTSKEIPALLSNVSQLGKESGLEFLLFKPAPEVSREFYAEIPVEIRVKGTYHNVALFFDRVGRLPRIVNISEVSMDNAKETSGRWEINTACTATTFKFIEKSPEELAKEKEKKPVESKSKSKETPPKKP
ncbi:MAG: type 4a pilus biogenesis protein PilO [Syntrophaceae bacterium]|jgi:type IV pilus assembly protein PilO|nr:type 4a pilus biogenesis protein PilO [Syntrophaceae bacterium]